MAEQKFKQELSQMIILLKKENQIIKNYRVYYYHIQITIKKMGQPNNGKDHYHVLLKTPC